MKGKIAEIFDSVQGEGLYFGERQLFVRFSGCNLKCRFCDTNHQDFTEYEPDELFGQIKAKAKNRFVSFTGGEPLLQKDFLKETLKLSQTAGFKNYLETNGTLPDELGEVIEFVDIVAMDFKLPSSTGMDGFWQAHRKFVKVACQKEAFIKIVICQDTCEADLRESMNLIKEGNDSAVLILQPNSYDDYDCLKEKVEKFKELCLEEGIASCIIPQVHKIIGVR